MEGGNLGANMKRFLLLAAMILAPALAWGQQTTVTATVTDVNSAAYAGGTGYAALVCPGNAQPTYNGYTILRSFAITGLDGTGTFTQVVYDVNLILPTSCGYQWHITAQNGVTSFITGTITSVTGASVNESTTISSYAAPLPGGAITGSGASGRVAFWSSPTVLSSNAGLTQAGGVLTAAGLIAAPFSVTAYPSVPTSDLFMGTTAAAAGNATTTGTDSLGIGSGALAAQTVPASGANPSANTAIGFNACNAVTTAREMTCIGNSAGQFFVGNGQGIEDGLSTFIGSFAGNSFTGSGALNTDLFCLGQKACVNLTGGGFDIFIGNHSGYNLVTATDGIFLGDIVAAGAAGQTMTSSADVIIGYSAAGAGTGAFQQNVIIGASAAKLTTATFEEVIIGNNAAAAQTTGNESTIVGYNAAAALTNGAADNFFGFDVAPTATGYNDDAFGSSACTTLTGGQYNNCFGNSSAIASGNDNYETVIGAQTTGNGSSTATIGAQSLTVVGPNAQTFGGSFTQGIVACETAYAATTVNTGSATTTTGQTCVPANSMIFDVMYRITTSITTAASFTVGISGSTSKFCSTQSTLTAGTTGHCLLQVNAGAAESGASAVAVVVTFNTTPGAGAMRLEVVALSTTAPTA